MKLYDFPPSGNGYKVRLLLSNRRMEYEYVPVDIISGENKKAWFLSKNPNGKVPVLELDDGRLITESNAIMFFLSLGTDFWPDNPLEQADVLKWLFFEQYSHEPNIATSRFWLNIRKKELSSIEIELIQQKQQQGYHALSVMEEHLNNTDFFVGGKYTIADIGLYAYTHVAHEGGFDLTPYSAVRSWLERVRSQDGYVTIDSISIPKNGQSY